MKIGVFDSGIGGISVLTALVRVKPYHDYFYLGDNLNAPYGDKTEKELRVLADNSVKTLLNYGAEIIVVACNTVSTTCKKYLIKKYRGVNFCFISPQITKKLIKKGCVVFCTQKTAQNIRKTKKYLSNFNKIQIISCKGLVEEIEKNFYNFNPKILTRYCSKVNNKIRVIVLGCTHYPLIATSFKVWFPQAEFYDGINPLVATLNKIEDKKVKNINKVNRVSKGKIFFLGKSGAQNYRIYAYFLKKITKSGKIFTKSG